MSKANNLEKYAPKAFNFRAFMQLQMMIDPEPYDQNKYDAIFFKEYYEKHNAEISTFMSGDLCLFLSRLAKKCGRQEFSDIYMDTYLELERERFKREEQKEQKEQKTQQECKKIQDNLNVYVNTEELDKVNLVIPCRFCKKENANVIVVPCNHNYMCIKCYEILIKPRVKKRQKIPCAICNGNVKMYLGGKNK